MSIADSDEACRKRHGAMLVRRLLCYSDWFVQVFKPGNVRTRATTTSR